MNLVDMKTVLLSYLISNAICALVITSLWIQNRRRFVGLGFWLADFVIQFLALLLVTLRGLIPDLLSMTASNTLVIGGTVLLYIGLEHFVGKRSAQWQNLLMLAVFIPIHIYFVIYPNLTARNLLFSFGLLLIFAQIAWLMLRRVEAKRRSLTQTAGVLFIVYCLVSLARIVIDLAIPSGNDFFRSNVYDTLVILCYQMLFIILTFNLFLMVNQHLLRDVERDIHTRIQTEKALKLSEEKFQKAFQSSPDSITISRASDGQMVEVNEGFSRMTGYSRDEALGNSSIAMELWAKPQDREAFVRTLRKNLYLRAVEYDFRAKSGKILHGLITAEIIQLGDEPHILSVTHDMTGRKQAEAALKESEQKFRLLFETMVDGVVYQDAQGHITSANPTAEKILGLTLEQMQGRTSIDPRWRAVHEDGSAFPGETHPAMVALRTGEPISNVVMGIYNPQAEAYRWINLNAVPQFRPGETRPYQVYATFDDITERRQAEAALRENKERYQAFISQSFEAIYRTEFDHPIDISLPVETQIDLIYANAYMAECNQALADMYHQPSVEAMIGIRLLDAHGSSDNPVNRATFRKFIEAGYKSSNDETMELDAFGNPIWFLSNTIGIVENGYLVWLWGTSINITERKQYEELVQVRLRLIQFADAHTLDELLQKTLDEAEVITDSKIGFFHFVEQDQNTLSLQAWSTRTVQDFCKAEGKGLHYDLANAGVWVDCVREHRPIVHNDYASLPNRKGMPAGHALVLRELVVPVFRDDHIMAILGVGNKPQDYTERDVEAISYLADIIWETTARKRAEEATIRLNAELEKRVAERTAEMDASNRELESLSYNIAHDMRSPVRAMVGYAAMLQESKGEKLDDDGRADLEIIHTSAIRLGQLIDDFLAYLHLGRVLLKKQPIRMADLVQHVKDEILSKNPQRQIRFSFGTLPDCQADLSLLEQVWTQLIDNAVKFTRLREVAEIEIGANEKDGKPCYFIHDNGIGFNMRYAEKIFDIFQHLNPLDDYGGTGAGLAIVRRILERHGGQVWAEAEVDKGATFYFTLN